jgi:hypothetical protein
MKKVLLAAMMGLTLLPAFMQRAGAQDASWIPEIDHCIGYEVCRSGEKGDSKSGTSIFVPLNEFTIEWDVAQLPEPEIIDWETFSCEEEQKSEKERDELAKEIADEIAARKAAETTIDRGRIEYGAGIFIRKDGSYGRTELFEGLRCSSRVNITYTRSQIGDGGRIVGDVHNHPEDGRCADVVGDENSPSKGDWKDVENNYIGDNNQFSSKDEFALYFVDSDGNLHEFDKNKWGQTKTDADTLNDGNNKCVARA